MTGSYRTDHLWNERGKGAVRGVLARLLVLVENAEMGGLRGKYEGSGWVNGDAGAGGGVGGAASHQHS